MKTKVDLLEIEKRMMNSINSNIKTMIKGIDKLNSESPLDVLQDINSEELEGVLKLTADRLEDNYPYYHPLYLGQMIKPPHPVARAAYHLAQWVNPNNHAYEGGRASSVMEKEAIDEMAKVFGWENCLGHVCSGGTIGNLEALWISSELKPGRAIVASDQAHYTHEKNAKLLKVPFIKVRSDEFGKIDLNDLDYILKNNDVGTIIATLGTTSLGAIDPLDDILQRQNQYEFRIHIDAAYGGYFTLSSVMKSESYKHFKRLKDVDSIVIDPHKHGLQPYGCGCILFKDPSVGKIYKHDSPYTYFTSSDYHLGETTFECSRPGASAVALWATQKYFPLIK